MDSADQPKKLTKVQRLELELEKARAQEKALFEKISARERERQRKRDTRRKILLGALFLRQWENADKRAAMQQILDQYLVKDADRELFDLPPRRGGHE